MWQKTPKHTLTRQHWALPPEWELLPEVVTKVGGTCGATLMDSSGDVEYSPSAAGAGANPSENTQTLGYYKVILLIHCNARVCVWMHLCVWPLEERKQKVNTFKTQENPLVDCCISLSATLLSVLNGHYVCRLHVSFNTICLLWSCLLLRWQCLWNPN